MRVWCGDAEPLLVTSTGLRVHGPSKVPCAPLRVVNGPCRNWASRVLASGVTGTGDASVSDQSARAWAAVYTGPFTATTCSNLVPLRRIVTKRNEFPPAVR